DYRFARYCFSSFRLKSPSAFLSFRIFTGEMICRRSEVSFFATLGVLLRWLPFEKELPTLPYLVWFLIYADALRTLFAFSRVDGLQIHCKPAKTSPILPVSVEVRL